MAAQGVPFYVSSVVNASSVALSGAKVRAFVPDSNGEATATPRVIYTDAACTTPASVPYSLGTSGQGVLYRKAAEAAVYVVKDSAEAVTYGTVYQGAQITSLDEDWLSYLDDDPLDVIRIKLTGNLGVFVNPGTAFTDSLGNVWATGSNSNTGLSRSSPLQTFAAAHAMVRDRYDFDGYQVTTTIAEAEITTAIFDVVGENTGQVNDYDYIIVGNTTTPANVHINNTALGSQVCIAIHDGARCLVKGFKLTCTNGYGIKVYTGGRGKGTDLIIAACGETRIQTADGYFNPSGAITCSGNAKALLVSEVGNGICDFGGATVTHSGAVTYSTATINVGEGSHVALHTVIWAGTTPTGRKYKATDVGNFSPPEKRDSIPGSLPGTIALPVTFTPQGRLSLTSGTPVTTGDVTGAGTIYWVPNKGNMTSAAYEENTADLGSYSLPELSLAFDSDSGHTGYAQSGKNADIFLFINDDDDLPKLGMGPVWTNDTTRAEDLALVKGIWTNASEIQLRYGTASGDLETRATGTCTYLGTVRFSANGQTEDSVSKRFVFNAYDRAPRAIRVTPGDDTWTGSGAATWRYFNNNSANRAEFVLGLLEDSFEAHATMEATSDQATIRLVRVGVGVNANTAIATGCLPQVIAADNTAPWRGATSSFRGYGQMGFNYAAPLEFDNASDTRTYRGDGGSPTNVQTGLVGTVRA